MFKWVGIVVATLVLLAIVFHRPLFFRLTRYFVVRVAEQQNLAIDYKIAGSIFTNLRITDLEATPTEPGPVERLRIGSMQLEYSLWELVQKGLPGFLESATLKDVFITIDPAKSSAPGQKQEPSTKFPALIPKTLTVENLNFTSRLPGDDLTIAGFDLLLDPKREGWLRAQTVQLPGIHTWTDVSAAATYANRNLTIKQLDLGPEMQVRQLSLDMSKLSNDALEFGVEATLFGGPTTVSGKITDLNESNVLTLSAISKDNSLAQASSYFGTVPPLDGMLRELRVDFAGAIAKPVTWSGGATIRVENFEGVTIAAPTDAKLVVTVADGKATLQSVELLQAENKASATATIDLPKTVEGFANLNAIGTVTGDLNEVGAVSGGTVKGSVEVQGNFTIKEGDLVADVSAQTDGLTAQEGEIGKADVRIQLKKALPDTTAPIWKGLETTITGKAGKLRFRDYEADSAGFNLTSRDDQVQVKNLTVGSAENKLELSGEFVLPEDPARFDQNLLSLDINLDAPDLKQLIAAKTGKQLKGDLSVSGKLTRKDGALNGSLSLSGSELEYGGLGIPRLRGDVRVVDGVVQLEQFQVALPENGSIAASGSYDLSRPNKYRGELEVAISDLGIMKPLLKAELGGSLKIDWRGTGSIHPHVHDGAATVALRGGRYNQLRALDVDLSGVYSPKSVQIPDFQVSSNLGSASAKVELREQALSVTNLVIRQDKTEVVRGELSIPFDLTRLAKPAELIPKDGAIAIDIASNKLNLGKLAALDEQSLRGTLTAKLQANGTMEGIRAKIDVEGKALHAPAMGKLRGADLNLNVVLENDRLRAEATLRQPEIQPLQLHGNVPFDLAAVIRQRGIDRTSPVDLSVKLPASSLAFVSKLSPAIRYAEGSVAIEANITGTIREPELSGSATIRFPALRMRNTTIPNISDGQVELQLQGRTVSIASAQMKVAGGPLSASGTVHFDELIKPALDLQVQGKSVLVMRNDDMTVRTDLDLSLTGPLGSAHVTGSVGITQSKLFREVELLPIGLPGRPPPPGLPEEATTVSINTPPIRDWTFDVEIKTVDPFKIRGNLANGGVVADLKLTGTGLEPELEGTATAKDLVLSLPFSRLHVRRGTAYFSPGEAVMNPRIDISAVADVRDYRINVYIYGTAEDPQTTFSSQPPLPQEEIIGLLATGATFDELSGDANVVAGRAGWLLLKKLYHKVFGGSTDRGDRDFLDRFDVNLGPIDPQTGAQTIVARFQIDENWVLIGTTGIGGGVQGKVKYLVRFR